jgi:hypothetical protein
MCTQIFLYKEEGKMGGGEGEMEEGEGGRCPDS